MSARTDEEVLAAAQLQMNAEQDERLSVLLDKQREGELLGTDRAELDALMQVYKIGLLRKARGIKEAVRRGLMEAPKP